MGPFGWDSKPFAVNSYHARNFVGFSSVVSVKLREALKRWIKGGSKGSLQKSFRVAISDVAHDSLQSCLADRMMVLSPGKLFDPAFACDKLLDTIGNVSASVQMMVVRTVFNSWATSHRYHERVVKGCLLGCRASA